MKFLVAALCIHGAAAGHVYSGMGNAASGDLAAVVAGTMNQASGEHCFIGGGEKNGIDPDTLEATIAGGNSNSNTGNYGAVAGGRKNRVYSNYATVGGGFLNRASGRFSHVPGGSKNTAGGRYSFAAGFDALTTGDYSGTFGFVAAGGCETRGDETFTVCAEVIDLQGTVLVDGEELVLNRRHLEANAEIRSEVAVLREEIRAMQKVIEQLQQQ